MYIMVGLPGSGKSTEAKKIYESYDDLLVKPVRINRDLLREMAHFGEYSKENEKSIRSISQAIAAVLLTAGVDVIIDDTNLKRATQEDWKEIAKNYNATAELVVMKTPLETCIARDRMRSNAVGEGVIRDMYERYLA